jgi:hypothetical protein
MPTTKLIIEKGDDGKLWGRIKQGDNLLVDSASTVEQLEKKMQTLLKNFHKIKEVKFKHFYDVSAFFQHFDFLNQSKLAELSEINPGLLRQYASGTKYPSPDQAKKIEKAIHKIATNLKAVSLYAA